jgi:hypothetical protein
MPANELLPHMQVRQGGDNATSEDVDAYLKGQKITSPSFYLSLILRVTADLFSVNFGLLHYRRKQSAPAEETPAPAYIQTSRTNRQPPEQLGIGQSASTFLQSFNEPSCWQFGG